MKPVFVEFRGPRASFWINVLRVESFYHEIKVVGNSQMPGVTIEMESGEKHFVFNASIAQIKDKISSEIEKNLSAGSNT